jgi:hypothetical protein
LIFGDCLNRFLNAVQIRTSAIPSKGGISIRHDISIFSNKSITEKTFWRKVLKVRALPREYTTYDTASWEKKKAENLA